MASAERTITYYFSFLSLWSYVGSLAFQDLADRTGAHVLYKPVDLFAVFAAGGGKPVKERPLQRQAYRLVEMQRWRQIRGIPLILHPKYYPADPSLAHRVLLAALDEGSEVAAYVHAGLKAVWADERDVGNPDTVRCLAEESGLDGGRLLQQAEAQGLREREASLTREAIMRQVFGAPFYFYRDEPFWGQDRLDLLEATIRGSAAPITLPDLSATA